MKKYYFLIVLALILGLALTGCTLLSNVGQVPTSEQSGISYSTKGTLTNPDVFTLYAGQDIDVGTVSVWNDAGDYLYVKYNTTSNWVMTETHLAVATSLSGIPQTKKGNPIPGKFEHSIEHDPAVTEYTYTIPLAGLLGADELYIAAHAAVKHVTEDECIDVVSDATAEWSSDELTWYPAVVCWKHPSWPIIVGAPYIWRTVDTDPAWEYANVPDGGWYFKKEFNLPETAFNIEGSDVQANVDNAYRIAINSVPLVLDGEGVMDKDDPVHGLWSTILLHSIPADTLQPGLNKIQLRAMNYYEWGTSTGNPAGLAFTTNICYDYYDMEESAWAADGEEPGEIPFPGKNWATYFNYTIEPVLIETLSVNSAAIAGSDSVNVLDEGKNYNFKVIGTWTNRGFEPVDAKYVSLSPYDWTTYSDAPGTPGGPWDYRLLELQVNEEFVNWGVYNSGHTYYLSFLGTGFTVNFRVFDGDPVTNIPNSGWYGDNLGSLIVDITWIP